MTHLIPQTVSSVLVADVLLTASEIFKIIGSAAQSGQSEKCLNVLSFGETSPVTCDSG